MPSGARASAASGSSSSCWSCLIILTPLSVAWSWPVWISVAFLFITLILLLFAGQTVIFLLRLVAADRREPDAAGRSASATRTVGELEDEATEGSGAPTRVRRRARRPRRRATGRAAGPACENSRGPSSGPGRPDRPVPVLATFFSVRRGRDPFFKFFMKTIFPRQVKEYEEKFGIRFIGWYNVAHGWDFDNVILLDLPDYGTLDKLEADEATRALGHRAGEWIFERHHSMFLRERARTQTSSTTAEGGDGMDLSRNDLLGEIANDAALERTDFIVQATRAARQVPRPQPATGSRELGGLTLIDDDPDYLSIAPDLTFRVRSRYEDPDTGEWVTETEVIENAAELVELYNPAEIYAAFAEAAREAAGFAAEPTAADDLLGPPAWRPRRRSAWASTMRTPAPPTRGPPASRRCSTRTTRSGAALALYNLALDFQERSQRQRGAPDRPVRGRVRAAASGKLGDLIIVDDDDERLILGAAGKFRAEVLPRTATASGGARRRRTSSSSSTTRPTSSVTWPTRSRRPSRHRPGVRGGAEGAAAEAEAGGGGCEAAEAPVAEATTVGDDETDDTASGNGRASALRPTKRSRPPAAADARGRR